MGGDVFVYFGGAGCLTNSFLDDGFVKVVTAGDACARVFGGVVGGKEVLPDPFLVCVGGFLFDGGGKVHCAEAVLKVFLVGDAYLLQMKLERLNQGFGQDGEAVVFAFSITNDDLAVVEVYIFDAEAHGFHDAEAATVHDLGNEFGCTREAANEAFDLFFGENGGDGFGTLGAISGEGEFIQWNVEHMAVKEEDGTEGLILGGG